MIPVLLLRRHSATTLLLGRFGEWSIGTTSSVADQQIAGQEMV
jgi:hypothetical protein